jgi:hypothetical protein
MGGPAGPVYPALAGGDRNNGGVAVQSRAGAAAISVTHRRGDPHAVIGEAATLYTRRLRGRGSPTEPPDRSDVAQPDSVSFSLKAVSPKR